MNEYFIVIPEQSLIVGKVIARSIQEAAKLFFGDGRWTLVQGTHSLFEHDSYTFTISVSLDHRLSSIEIVKRRIPQVIERDDTALQAAYHTFVR